MRLARSIVVTTLLGVPEASLRSIREREMNEGKHFFKRGEGRRTRYLYDLDAVTALLTRVSA